MSCLYSFRSFRHLLWVGLLAGIVPHATAQTAPDSTRISYGEEVITTPAAEVPLRVQREEPHLWKLGLNNFTPRTGWFYYTRYGIHLAYERKLNKPAWSVMGEVSPALTYYRPLNGEQVQRRLGVRTQVAGRYYYNLGRRLRLGRNTGNFSANYISVALGAGLGRQARETSFYYIEPNGRWVKLDVAVSYGLQRRLGRYGFIDFNVGFSSLLADNKPEVNPGGSLRVGLALASWPASTYYARPAPVDEDEALRPRAYMGIQLLGVYAYRVRYAQSNPYRGSQTVFPGLGYGVYTQELNTPFFYAGYSLRPRLAVEVGVQKQRDNYSFSFTSFQNTISKGAVQQRDLVLPVRVRYTITRSFLQRIQFDAVGGVVPHWSSVRYQEQEFLNDDLVNEYGFSRRSFNLHASGGLSMGYGIGRRRRIQLTLDYVITKDLQTGFRGSNAMPSGGGLGVRYRFGYQ